jgi:hypothetical protein
MSLPDNGSITAAQLMDYPGQTYLCRWRQFLAFQSDSEPNHAFIVTCATHLAAVRHNEWDNRPLPRRTTQGNQDHKLAGRVASDFGPSDRVANQLLSKSTVGQFLSAQTSEAMQRSDRRAAAGSY